jgi:hypothetical protein
MIFITELVTLTTGWRATPTREKNVWIKMAKTWSHTFELPFEHYTVL